MTAAQLITVHPDELKFLFELGKQIFCDLKVVNNTEHHVAFKVKTTSPKKYCVRPNRGVIQPWDSCVIRVTRQAQNVYPPDMQCKDQFLLQSTVVPPRAFSKIEQLDKPIYCNLKVVNNTKHHVAFKLITTTPKKYFSLPKTGVIQPRDSCVIRVNTLQALNVYPPGMQCKDKFLLQSTVVPPHADVDQLPADTFNKDGVGKVVEECKLRVVYQIKETPKARRLRVLSRVLELIGIKGGMKRAIRPVK
ncbi:Plant VAMP (vesicle-associated membrane protein) family protein [Euphorbia peplus]|nr:Plant VAMP (vesicle-associated membrane protein) family protein [Euphorbia peplus]